MKPFNPGQWSPKTLEQRAMADIRNYAVDMGLFTGSRPPQGWHRSDPMADLLQAPSPAHRYFP